MMLTLIRRFLAVTAIILLAFFSQAQPVNSNEGKARPYKILTAGKRITIKSTKNIASIIVWTASGQRIIEQKDLNNLSFSFDVSNVNDKVLFIMIRYEDAKPYTEKIGI